MLYISKESKHNVYERDCYSSGTCCQCKFCQLPHEKFAFASLWVNFGMSRHRNMDYKCVQMKVHPYRRLDCYCRLDYERASPQHCQALLGYQPSLMCSSDAH